MVHGEQEYNAAVEASAILFGSGCSILAALDKKHFGSIRRSSHFKYKKQTLRQNSNFRIIGNTYQHIQKGEAEMIQEAV